MKLSIDLFWWLKLRLEFTDEYLSQKKKISKEKKVYPQPCYIQRKYTCKFNCGYEGKYDQMYGHNINCEFNPVNKKDNITINNYNIINISKKKN